LERQIVSAGAQVYVWDAYRRHPGEWFASGSLVTARLIELDPLALIPIGVDGCEIKRRKGCRYATELSTGEVLTEHGSFPSRRAWIASLEDRPPPKRNGRAAAIRQYQAETLDELETQDARSPKSDKDLQALRLALI
jgi:hypothetical protein